MKASVTKKAGKKKLSAEELKKRATIRKEAARKRYHIKSIRDTFINSTFKHVTEASGKQFSFKGRTCDFDEVFILENVLVLVEHTAHNESHVSDHLIKKSIVFGYIVDDKIGFVSYIRREFPDIGSYIPAKYADHDVEVRIVYCSLNSLKDSTKQHVSGVKFLDNPQLKYFLLLSRAIRRSSRFELLDFLDILAKQFGAAALDTGSATTSLFEGLLLPESQSHLPKDFKLVSFYVSAGALIQRAYVLRRDSWRDNSNIYQRVLIKKKIDAMRRHLVSKKGAFINNVIVSLPNSTRFLDRDGNQFDASKIYKAHPIRVQLPADFNSIAIIDGQHRVLSYFEGGADEETIANLREQQNLLVTGIVLPSSMTQSARDRFAAGVFLQINSNQTKPKPELIQEIGVILRPFAVNSIARRVLWTMNSRGPFMDQFQTAFSEGEKVKTASIVNYGLEPIIRPGATGSLFAHWSDPDKEDIIKGVTNEGVNEDVILRYVDFCTREINKFSGAFKNAASVGRWTTTRSVPDKLLTALVVNGIVHALREISANGDLHSAEYYRSRITDLSTFDFSQFTSSHWNEMGKSLAKHYFAIENI
jgi:DGQHR domain-containing protein